MTPDASFGPVFVMVALSVPYFVIRFYNRKIRKILIRKKTGNLPPFVAAVVVVVEVVDTIAFATTGCLWQCHILPNKINSSFQVH